MKFDLPGGGWFVMKDADELTGADQDEYYDLVDEFIAAHPAPEPKPDPDNPAVMLPAPPRRFTNADGRALRDRMLGKLVTSWSRDEPLPITAELRRQLPARVNNALNRAYKPLDDVLSDTEEAPDGAPKEEAPSGTGGSSGTSEDGTESPLPESPEGTSGTP